MLINQAPFQRHRKETKRSKGRTNQGRLAANSRSSADGWIDGSMPIDVVNLYRSTWATARSTVALWTSSGGQPSERTLSSFFLARLTCTCKLAFFAWCGSALRCSLRREFRPLFLSGTMCFGFGFSNFCLARNFFVRECDIAERRCFSSRGRAASRALISSLWSLRYRFISSVFLPDQRAPPPLSCYSSSPRSRLGAQPFISAWRAEPSPSRLCLRGKPAACDDTPGSTRPSPLRISAQLHQS